MSRARPYLLLAAVLGALLTPAPTPGTGSDPAPAQARRIERLIRQLGSDEFEDREKAAAALHAIGEPALAALLDAEARSKDPEVRWRARVLLGGHEGRFAEAEDFADALLPVLSVLHRNSVAEPGWGDLGDHTVRALYHVLGQKMPSVIARGLGRRSVTEGQVRVLLRNALVVARPGKGQDAAALVNGTLDEMLPRVDPHAGWYNDPPAGCVLRDDAEWEGIGLELRTDPETKMAQVVTPLKAGPAYRAGVRAEDVIIHVTLLTANDGKPLCPAQEVPTRWLAVSRVQRYFRGPPGTPVGLTVRRRGEKKPLSFVVRRARVTPEKVLGWRRKADDNWDYWLDPAQKIAYVRLTDFGRDSDRELTRVVRRLHRQGMKGLILDLRFNPGGLLDGAVHVADLFLDDGPILTIRTRFGGADEWPGQHAGSLLDFPMVCLVNGASAKASEIVAGALQDKRRARIVGERTAGEGGIQHIKRVAGGELKFTMGVFIRPGGKKLDRIRLKGHGEDEWGVTPDKGHLLQLTPRERERLREHLERSTYIYPPGRDRANFTDRQRELALAHLRSRVQKSARPQAAARPHPAPAPSSG